MYICTVCEYKSATKLWKCPSCLNFWTFEDAKDEKKIYKWKAKPWYAKQIQNQEPSLSTFYNIENTELLRVLQKWIKKWWVYLLGWEPWIWKSTIILQIIIDVIKNNPELKIWYFSWEESQDQIFQRLRRLYDQDLNNISIFYSTVLEDIILTADVWKYDIIILDSIQTVYSNSIDGSAWSPSQVRYCSEKISEFCKNNLITWIVIGHVTKWWEIAWPKYLEHIVDVVLYLEGDRFGQYRFLRSYKNRFWNTDDVWIFEMFENWLKPVYNLKDVILNLTTKWPGNTLTIWIDNGRPIIVSVEVLLNKTKYKYPERKSIWVDINRLNLIIAILEKYLNIWLWFCDIFVNIPWEFKFYDSWIDLAIAAAIYTSYKNINLPKNMVFLGELWLGWQIIKSKYHEKRTKEVPSGFEIIDTDKLKNIFDLKNII